MIKVGRLSEFPKDGWIAQFLGKDFDDAVGKAGAWQKVTGHECSHYYEQKLRTKTVSILVHYKKEDKNADS